MLSSLPACDLSPSRRLDQLRAGVALARTVLEPGERPDRLVRAVGAAAPWRDNLAAPLVIAATRHPERTALVDDRGSISYAGLLGQAVKLAGHLDQRSLGPGSRIGVLAANGRGFVTMVHAAAMSGADVILLNTAFAPPQLAEVVASEGIDLVLADAQLAPLCQLSPVPVISDDQLDELEPGRRLGPPSRSGRLVILTSGTTGRPKGTGRHSTDGSLVSAGSLLERVPLRPGDRQLVPAPFFHGWGLAHLMLGISRCATTITARHFDAEAVLAAVPRHRARVLAVVPVMLARMLEVDRRVDTSSLEVIASSGSALGAPLVARVMERFGPVLYNVYGSTEVAMVSIATPDDLEADPGTAGRVALGVELRLVDAEGAEVATGEVGRVFAGSDVPFEGYTSGGDKARIDGLISTGDLGRLDAQGRLRIEGREDDMIVSGGENVFPGEVEDLLSLHPEVAEVAVTARADAEFGQVLVAHVVPRPGTRPDPELLRDHVRSRLARFKVPREVHLIEELPRTPTGKLVRRQLSP